MSLRPDVVKISPSDSGSLDLRFTSNSRLSHPRPGMRKIPYTKNSAAKNLIFVKRKQSSNVKSGACIVPNIAAIGIIFIFIYFEFYVLTKFETFPCYAG